MDKFECSTLLKAFLLNERTINTAYRKYTQLNKTELETLTFANENLTFTIYRVQKSFNHTNVQIIRRSIKKLIEIRLIERIGTGMGSNAAIYMITKKGQQYFQQYLDDWITLLKIQ